MIFGACVTVLIVATGPDGAFVGYGAFAIAPLSLSSVGALLAVHRSGNPLGWIFLSAGLSYNIFLSADRYAYYITETAPDTLPPITLLFWLGSWMWILALFVPATFGILLFPTGRLPSRQWLPFAWFVAISLTLMGVGEMLSPGPLLDPPDAYPQFPNPAGVEALAGLLTTVLEYADLVLLFVLAGSVISTLSRLRGATVIERQQIKWFAFAAIVPSMGVGIYMVLFALPQASSELANGIGEIAVTLGIATLPVTVGIAILRHNLYDIDRLINRTLVYGSLTLLLALGFIGSVIAFQFILSPLTRGNDLAVVGSTLIAFSLFRPVRRRLQVFVDQRFYRQKYDARQILEAFRINSYQAVDSDDLQQEIVDALTMALQPEHMSIWIRANTMEKRRI